MGTETLAYLAFAAAAAGTAQQMDTARRTENQANDARNLAADQAAKDKADGLAKAAQTTADAATAANSRNAFARKAMRANSLLTGAGEAGGAATAARTTLGV